ncbi:hypothetical protein DdX_10167 [Ditylenchus destructor]|uniref:Uncharacterized protein n=1 Tax=Ditylenchus destructor TaxID=166010 RepID=A0AAD4MZE6_9BILA|nr:hypothetical protein DdX_10167 [Ditylenchus destructor]
MCPQAISPVVQGRPSKTPLETRPFPKTLRITTGNGEDQPGPIKNLSRSAKRKASGLESRVAVKRVFSEAMAWMEKYKVGGLEMLEVEYEMEE